MAKKSVKNRSKSSKVSPDKARVQEASTPGVSPGGLDITSLPVITSPPEKVSVPTVPVAVAGAPAADEAMSPIPVVENTGVETSSSERRHIVRSATLVMLGNLGSSVMGMVRQLVVAALGTAISGPFFAA